MNQLAKEDAIFSSKSRKIKKDTANKPYWDNTHPIQTSVDDEEDDKDEAKRPKGYDLLKKIYGGGSHSQLIQPALQKKLSKNYDKVVDNYSDVVKHLEEHQREGVGDPKDVKQSNYLRGEIQRINNLHLIPANQVASDDPLYKYSNPRKVQQKAFQLFGKNAVVYKSDRKDKKYQILNENTGKFSHFGQLGYEDYSHHLSQDRRLAYLRRATAIKGDWKNDVYSPNFLAISLLWG
jgi:hypothetical protein